MPMGFELLKNFDSEIEKPLRSVGLLTKLVGTSLKLQRKWTRKEELVKQEFQGLALGGEGKRGGSESCPHRLVPLVVTTTIDRERDLTGEG